LAQAENIVVVALLAIHALRIHRGPRGGMFRGYGLSLFVSWVASLLQWNVASVGSAVAPADVSWDSGVAVDGVTVAVPVLAAAGAVQSSSPFEMRDHAGAVLPGARALDISAARTHAPRPVDSSAVRRGRGFLHPRTHANPAATRTLAADDLDAAELGDGDTHRDGSSDIAATFLQSSGLVSEVVGGVGGALEPEVYLGLLGEQLLQLRAQIDTEHLECAQYEQAMKRSSASLDVDRFLVSSDLLNVESEVTSSLATIQPIAGEVNRLKEQLDMLHSNCRSRRVELEARIHPQQKMLDRFRVLGLGGAEMPHAALQVARLDEQCRVGAEALNTKIRERVSMLVNAQNGLLLADSQRKEPRAEMARVENRKQRLLESSARKQQECTGTLEQLEREVQGVIESRHLLYRRFINSSDLNLIRDCEVSEWSIGPCSTSCTSWGENPGTQQLLRSVVFQPDRSKPEGRFGAKCPALVGSMPCNADVPCPVDCEIKEWSGWATCSKQCGGGEQYRTRAVVRDGLYDGRTCGNTIQTRRCNLQACGRCEGGDWGSLGPCSRRCQWSTEDGPGHAVRWREGCLGQGRQSELQECNSQQCPSDLGRLNCTGQQDVIVVLDGGGDSHHHLDFMEGKALVEGLIEHSALSSSSGTGGGRYGLLVFGGDRAHVVTPLNGSRSVLLHGLEDAQPPNATHDSVTAALSAAAALQTAAHVLQLSRTDPQRYETVVLLADEELRKPHAAVPVAAQLRKVGVRVVVVLVRMRGHIANTAKVKEDEWCGVASEPCSDHLLQTKSWADLRPKLGRYLATICSAGFLPP